MAPQASVEGFKIGLYVCLFSTDRKECFFSQVVIKCLVDTFCLNFIKGEVWVKGYERLKGSFIENNMSFS